MPRMSDRPMSVVSSARHQGTQARSRLRSAESTDPSGTCVPPALAAGTFARFACPASSLSLISAAFLSGPRACWVSVVIAPPRVLPSRYLPRVNKGPIQRDGVSSHRRKYPECAFGFPRRPEWPLAYPIDAAGGLCGSAATVNDTHRLGAGDVVVAEGAAHGRGHRPRSRLAHPAHGHAQVFRLDDHHHAA